VVLDRISRILHQLPQAIHQAHERIIGERRVDNAEKILSLYEPDLHVIVRGKAGAEVEFGNGLYLAEQSEGLIVDWSFMQEQPPSDGKLALGSVRRLTAEYGTPASYTGDRGFDSSVNRVELESIGIFNAICPRSVSLLKESSKTQIFVFCKSDVVPRKPVSRSSKTPTLENRCEARALKIGTSGSNGAYLPTTCGSWPVWRYNNAKNWGRNWPKTG